MPILKKYEKVLILFEQQFLVKHRITQVHHIPYLLEQALLKSSVCLPIAGERITGFIPSFMVLVPCKMLTASSRF